MSEGRIQKALSGFYYVDTGREILTCRARGKFRKEGVSPLVGDRVEVRELGGGEGFVEKILPRRNAFSRPMVANIDQLVIIASAAIPQTDPFLIDRVTAIAGNQNVPVVLCINKTDLEEQDRLGPIYEKAGGVPAIKEVQFSLVSQRGCFGGCNFCAIISHEGRIIQRRSHASLIREAKILTHMKGFKGYIHDVGGPTANFRRTSCDGQLKRGTCRGKPCLSPEPCKLLVADHSDYIKLLRELRSLPGVKKVFVRSGIRFDYLLLAKDDFLYELCKYHVSGQLKIAPEHISDRVTRLMGKSNRAVYLRFVEKFRRMNERLGKKQYLVPYFMSSHPGSELSDAVELAEFIRDMGYHPQQVQDFIPTPGTLSTCMWYTGLDPMTGEKVYSAKSYEEKRMQRALMQYWLPKNHEIVRKALHLAHREDLIGFGPKCLVRPRRETRPARPAKKV